MQEAIDAIKAKYNLSDEEAKQVLGVLIAAEHQRQMGGSSGNAPAAGMRGMKSSASADMRGIDVGDLLGIAGSLLGGAGGGGGQGNSTSQLLNVVGDLIGSATNQGGGGSSGGPDLGSVLGSLLGGASGGNTQMPQGGGSMDLGSLLGGLLGGAGGGGAGQVPQQQQPQQGGGGMDLLGMLGGLIGGAGAQQSAQSGDIGGLLNSLLGGGGAPQQQQPQQGGGQFYSPQDVQQQAPQGGGAQLGQGKPGKKDYGSIGNAMDKMSASVQQKPKTTKMGAGKGKSGGAPAKGKK